MDDTYMWYDSETDEEREISADKVQSLARVIRAITETETDSDHIQAALQDFVELNTILYGNPFWPENKPTKKDVQNAVEVAEELSIDHLPDTIRTLSQYYNSDLPSPIFTTKILDSSGTKISEESAPGIDGAQILQDYDTKIQSVDWDSYTVLYEKQERES